MQDGRLKNLFNSISAKYDIGTYDEWSNAMLNEDRRKNFFNNVSQVYDIGDYEKFDSIVGAEIVKPYEAAKAARQTATAGAASATATSQPMTADDTVVQTEEPMTAQAEEPMTVRQPQEQATTPEIPEAKVPEYMKTPWMDEEKKQSEYAERKATLKEIAGKNPVDMTWEERGRLAKAEVPEGAERREDVKPFYAKWIKPDIATGEKMAQEEFDKETKVDQLVREYSLDPEQISSRNWDIAVKGEKAFDTDRIMKFALNGLSDVGTDKGKAMNDLVLKRIGMSDVKDDGRDTPHAPQLTQQEVSAFRRYYGYEFGKIAEELQKQMYDEYKAKNAPKSTLDYILGGVVKDNIMNQIAGMMIEKAANSSGMRRRIREEAYQDYSKDAGVLTNAAAGAAKMVSDPVFLASMGAGSLAGEAAAGAIGRHMAKNMVKKAGADMTKGAIEAGTRYAMANSVPLAVAQGAISSGMTLGLSSALHTTAAQAMNGQWDAGEIAKAFGEDALVGAVTGGVGSRIALAARGGSRMAQIGAATAGYGTNVAAFSAFQLWQKAAAQGKDISDLTMDEVAETVGENAAMFAIMDLPKFAKAMRSRAADARKSGMELSPDMIKELKDAGYEGLFDDLLRMSEVPQGNAESGEIMPRAMGEAPQRKDAVLEKLNAMVKDNKIGSETRRRMYWYATGKMLMPDAVFGVSGVTANEDGTYSLSTIGADGQKIETRSFGSLDEARKWQENFDLERQANMSNMLEQSVFASARNVGSAIMDVAMEKDMKPEDVIRAIKLLEEVEKQGADDKLNLSAEETALYNEAAALRDDVMSRAKAASEVEGKEILDEVKREVWTETGVDLDNIDRSKKRGLWGGGMTSQDLFAVDSYINKLSERLRDKTADKSASTDAKANYQRGYMLESPSVIKDVNDGVAKAESALARVDGGNEVIADIENAIASGKPVDEVMTDISSKYDDAIVEAARLFCSALNGLKGIEDRIKVMVEAQMENEKNSISPFVVQAPEDGGDNFLTPGQIVTAQWNGQKVYVTRLTANDAVIVTPDGNKTIVSNNEISNLVAAGADEVLRLKGVEIRNSIESDVDFYANHDERTQKDFLPSRVVMSEDGTNRVQRLGTTFYGNDDKLYAVTQIGNGNANDLTGRENSYDESQNQLLSVAELAVSPQGGYSIVEGTTRVLTPEDAYSEQDAYYQRQNDKEAKLKAEEEARLKAEEEAKKAEEEAKLKAEEEAKKAEEEARLKAEEEAKKAELEVQQKAEEEAKANLSNNAPAESQKPKKINKNTLQARIGKLQPDEMQRWEDYVLASVASGVKFTTKDTDAGSKSIVKHVTGRKADIPLFLLDNTNGGVPEVIAHNIWENMPQRLKEQCDAGDVFEEIISIVSSYPSYASMVDDLEERQTEVDADEDYNDEYKDKYAQEKGFEDYADMKAHEVSRRKAREQIEGGIAKANADELKKELAYWEKNVQRAQDAYKKNPTPNNFKKWDLDYVRYSAVKTALDKADTYDNNAEGFFDAPSGAMHYDFSIDPVSGKEIYTKTDANGKVTPSSNVEFMKARRKNPESATSKEEVKRLRDEYAVNKLKKDYPTVTNAEEAQSAIEAIANQMVETEVTDAEKEELKGKMAELKRLKRIYGKGGSSFMIDDEAEGPKTEEGDFWDGLLKNGKEPGTENTELNRVIGERLVEQLGKVIDGEVKTPTMEEAQKELMAVRGKNRRKTSKEDATFASNVSKGGVMYALSKRKPDSEVKGKDKELYGVHNLSIENLTHAFRMGGLANPSTAVVSTKVGGFNNFGAISLIMPKSLVEKASGKNAGTWSADAYSPRYPIGSVTGRFTGNGFDEFEKDALNATDNADMNNAIRNKFRLGVEDNSYRMGELAYWYMTEKGLNPEKVYVQPTQMTPLQSEIMEIVGDKEWRDFTDEQKAAIGKLYVDDSLKTLMPTFKRKLKNGKTTQEQIDKMVAIIEADGRDEDVAWNLWRDAVKAKERSEIPSDKLNVYSSAYKAMDYVNENGLSADFDAWIEEKKNKYGVEERIFDGYTPSGRKYKAHTLENVSKMMKKEGRAGSESMFETTAGALRAKVSPVFSTLQQMKKAKGRLVGKEKMDAVKEEINDEYYELKYLLSEERYSDEGHYRLEEALMHGVDYVNSKYKLELDAEDADRIRVFGELLKTAPTEYFETKFERPVGIGEFAAAVVPNNTPKILRDALANEGLTVTEYDPQKEGDRQRVTKDVVNNTDNVLFSVVDGTDRYSKNPDNASFMTDAGEVVSEYDKAVADKDEKAAAGIVRNAFAIECPFTKIVDENGMPEVVYHGTYWNPNEEKNGEAVFNEKYIGTASGDNGFFGRGFYFARYNKEAGMYGENVIKAYLNITNPFNYWEEMKLYDGKPCRNRGFGMNGAVTYNMAKKFGDLFSDVKISFTKWHNGEGVSTDMSLKAFAKVVDKLMKDMEFELGEVDDDFFPTIGKPEDYFTVHTDKQIEKGADGKEYVWYEYNNTYYGKPEDVNKLDMVLDYLEKKGLNGYQMGNLPDTRIEFQRHGISGELKKRGYDGMDVGDEVVAFYPNQIKSADPFTYDENGEVIPIQERFDMDNPDIRFSMEDYADTFYSNAENAVNGIAQKKATPEQWINMLKKNGGLKAEEDKWLGLTEWLNGHDAGKSISKDEVIEYIQANKIQLEEVRYKEHDNTLEGFNNDIEANLYNFLDSKISAKDKYSEEAESEREKLWDYYINSYGESLSKAIDRNPFISDGEVYTKDRGEAIKFSNFLGITPKELNSHPTRLVYTTKGLDNNKEIVLTVPTVEPFQEYDEIHFGTDTNGKAIAWCRFGETITKDGEAVKAYDEALKKAYDYEDMLAEKYETSGETEENRDVCTEEEAAQSEANWSEVSRLESTVDELPEKRVLLIDEIQSKRHQTGRKYGYIEEGKQTKHDVSQAVLNAKNELDTFVDYVIEGYDFKVSEDEIGTSDIVEESLKRKYNELKSEYLSLKKAYDETEDGAYANDDAVPDAPFRSNWPELVVKRMIRYAAENGYDKIAWTTGRQQADRYNIGKRIEYISCRSKSEKGSTYYLESNSFIQGGNIVTDKDGVIIFATGGFYDSVGTKLSEVLGEDIAKQMADMEPDTQISNVESGGEGMKAFYDNMLVKAVGKYVKKWGSSVGMKKITNLDREMWCMDVTDQMKSDVLHNGQPMFMKNGTIYGYTKGKDIYLLPNGINANTPVHEYEHLWAEAMEKNNPEGWASIVDILKKTPLWDEVMSDKAYINIHGDENKVASECLSRGGARYNNKKVKEILDNVADDPVEYARQKGFIRKIWEALNKFWKWTAENIFKIKKFNSFEEVMQQSLGDFYNGRDLKTGEVNKELGQKRRAEAKKADKAPENTQMQLSDFSDKDQERIREASKWMTKKDAKRMLEMVYNAQKPYFDEYVPFDKWVKETSTRDMSMIAENEFAIQDTFINPIYSKTKGFGNDFWTDHIIDAYKLGLLDDGNANKVKAQRVDLGNAVKVSDDRWYAPKQIEIAEGVLDVAKQRVNKKNEKDVMAARQSIVLYAHNEGAAETLGLTKAEFNKMLRSWTRETAKARELSLAVNKGVEESNRWSGIENVASTNAYTISDEEIARMTGGVEGDSNGMMRKDIARTMLAIDTHTDWSGVRIKFAGSEEFDKDYSSMKSPKNVAGFYSKKERLVEVRMGRMGHTTPHEMGHALDHIWGLDLGLGDYLTYSKGTKLTGDEKLFADHVNEFITELIKSNADIRNDYTTDRTEVFARFVDYFVSFTESIAHNVPLQRHQYFEDKFTAGNVMEFVRILQEKSVLDSQRMAGKVSKESTEYEKAYADKDENDIRYHIDDYGMPLEYSHLYGEGNTREMAHNIKGETADGKKISKSEQEAAIKAAAKDMAKSVSADAVLIPVPSHLGYATDTKKLAEAIAEISGAEVADVLKSIERQSNYEYKKQNGKSMPADELGFYLDGDVPEGKEVVIVDNVIGSGTTARAALDAVGEGSVLAYSLDDAAYDDVNFMIELSDAGNREVWEHGKVNIPDKIVLAKDGISGAVTFDADARKVMGVLDGEYDIESGALRLTQPMIDELMEAMPDGVAVISYEDKEGREYLDENVGKNAVIDNYTSRNAAKAITFNPEYQYYRSVIDEAYRKMIDGEADETELCNALDDYAAVLQMAIDGDIERRVTDGAGKVFASERDKVMDYYDKVVNSEELKAPKFGGLVKAEGDKLPEVKAENEENEAEADVFSGDMIELGFKNIPLRMSEVPHIKEQAELMPQSSGHGWDGVEPNVVVITSNLRSRYPQMHEAAKHGDVMAAYRIVAESFGYELNGKRTVSIKAANPAMAKVVRMKKNHPDAVVVYPHRLGEERGNVLGQMYVDYLRDVIGFEADENLVMINRPGHTDASKDSRLLKRARFDGEVQKGREYIIADDHITMGCTVRDMKDYIESKGGKVVAVSTLTKSMGDAAALVPTEEQINQLKELGVTNEQLKEYGIANDVRDITRAEAKELLMLSKSGRNRRGSSKSSSLRTKGYVRKSSKVRKGNGGLGGKSKSGSKEGAGEASQESLTPPVQTDEPNVAPVDNTDILGYAKGKAAKKAKKAKPKTAPVKKAKADKEFDFVEAYKAYKKKRPDTTTMFRHDDNYEIYDKDALVASSILGLPIEKHESGLDMVRFNKDELDVNLPRLIRAALRCNIAEYLGDTELKLTPEDNTDILGYAKSKAAKKAEAKKAEANVTPEAESKTPEAEPKTAPEAESNAPEAESNAPEAKPKSNTYKTKDGKKIEYKQLSLFDLTDDDGQPKFSDDKSNRYGKADKVTGYDLEGIPSEGMCLVERRYTENGMFSFMGKEKIKNADDCAYLFKQLENKAIENSFLALIDKNDEATIIHCGIGDMTGASFDLDAFPVAIEAVNPKIMYMVHNHPSGRIVPSTSDSQVLSRLRNMFPKCPIYGIIIDTLSGKYSLFDSKRQYNLRKMSQATGDERNYKVFSFNKLVFDRNYVPNTISNHNDVAAFISSYRLGNMAKVCIVCVDQLAGVTGVVPLTIDWNNSSASLIAEKIRIATAMCNCRNAILYGSGVTFSRAKDINTLCKTKDVAILDFVKVNGNYQESASEQNVVFDSTDMLSYLKRRKNKGIVTYTTKTGEKITYKQLDLFDDAEKEEIDEFLPENYRIPLNAGDICYAERRYTENGLYKFDGSEKIETPDDVAYLFRAMQNVASSNLFYVLINDKKEPLIIHAGMGNNHDIVSPDLSSISLAVERYEPQTIYAVTNHPSGNVAFKKEDRSILVATATMYPSQFAGYIVIDTNKGVYGFRKYGNEVESEIPKTGGDNEFKVYSFDRQVFSKEFDISSGLNGGSDVAIYLSTHRFGKRRKLGLITLNNNCNVTGDFALTTTDMSKTQQIADNISNTINMADAVFGIVYGEGIDVRGWRKIAEMAKDNGVRLLDVVCVPEDGKSKIQHWDGSERDYISAEENGLLNEDAPVYSPQDVVNEENMLREEFGEDEDTDDPEPKAPELEDGELLTDDSYRIKHEDYVRRHREWVARQRENEKRSINDVLFSGDNTDAPETGVEALDAEALEEREMFDEMMNGAKVDVTMKAIKGMIKEQIRERRRLIESSNYEDAIMAHDIRKVTTPEERKRIPFILEGTDTDPMTDNLKEVVEKIRNWFDEVHQFMSEEGLFMADEKKHYIDNYVTHIWDFENVNPDKIAELRNWVRLNSPYTRERIIPTLAAGLEMGLKMKYDDITDIMMNYGHYATEAVANRRLVNFLKGFKVDGYRILQPDYVKDADYVRIDNNALDGLKVYKGMVPVLDVVFGRLHTTSNPTLQKVAHVYDVAGSVMKKINLSLSFFHHGALTETALSMLGPDKFGKALFKNMIWDAAMKKELPAFLDVDATRDAVNHLVTLGATQDYLTKDVQNFTSSIRRFMESNNVHGIREGAQLVDMLNKGMDMVLWDWLHDGYKIYSFKKLADEIRAKGEKLGWPNDKLNAALDEAGQLVNDTFGGQHWDLLGFSPSDVKWARRFLLSPDWTISTIRQALSPFGIGAVYENRTFWERVARKNKPSADREDILAVRRKYGSAFWLMATLIFITFYNGLNALFRKKDESDELAKAEEMRKVDADYKSPYELAYPDGMKWYDYTMMGNTLGQQTHLFTGRYDDGKEKYLRWGKQFRELPELFFGRDGFSVPGPMIDKIAGKLNPMINLASNVVGGKSVNGWENPFMKNTKGWEKDLGRVQVILSSFTPYSIPTDSEKEFVISDLFMPSSKGFTAYKAKRGFETAISSGDIDMIGQVYNACVMNGLNADELFETTLKSIEATARKSMVEGVESVGEACKKFDEESNPKRRAQLARYIKRMMSAQDYSQIEKGELIQKANDIINGDVLDSKGVKEYDKLCSSKDVIEDWRLGKAITGLKPIHDEYMDMLMTSDPDAKKYFEAHKKSIVMYNKLTGVRSVIGKLKTQLGKPEYKDNNGNHINDQMRLDRIREIRFKALSQEQ